MTYNNILKWLELAYQLASRFMKLAVVLVLGLSVILAIIITILYLPAFLQKKINLKASEDIRQHNLEIVEKAIFFETSTEFNELIQKQIADIRANEAKLKAQRAEASQRATDETNSKGKK